MLVTSCFCQCQPVRNQLLLKWTSSQSLTHHFMFTSKRIQKMPGRIGPYRGQGNRYPHYRHLDPNLVQLTSFYFFNINFLDFIQTFSVLNHSYQTWEWTRLRAESQISCHSGSSFEFHYIMWSQRTNGGSHGRRSCRDRNHQSKKWHLKKKVDVFQSIYCVHIHELSMPGAWKCYEIAGPREI